MAEIIKSGTQIIESTTSSPAILEVTDLSTLTEAQTGRLRQLELLCADQDPVIAEQLNAKLEFLRSMVLYDLKTIRFHSSQPAEVLQRYEVGRTIADGDDAFDEDEEALIHRSRIVMEVSSEEMSDSFFAKLEAEADQLETIFGQISAVAQYGVGDSWLYANQHAIALQDWDCDDDMIYDTKDKITNAVGYYPGYSASVVMAFEQPIVDIRIVITRQAQVGVRVEFSDDDHCDIFLQATAGMDGLQVQVVRNESVILDKPYSFMLTDTELRSGPYANKQKLRQKNTLVMIDSDTK